MAGLGVAEMNLGVTDGLPCFLKGRQLSMANPWNTSAPGGGADVLLPGPPLMTPQREFFGQAGARHQARPPRWLAAHLASS